MRDIEIDDLRRIEIAGEVFQKPDWCDSEVKGCFIDNHGTIVLFCERCLWRHNGFKCGR